jgi:serine/threonine protein phosphatase PrpC
MGKRHRSNEDRIVYARFGDRRGELVQLVILCDGMGGMTDGARCAEVGLSAFVLALVSGLMAHDHADRAMKAATEYANHRLWQEFHGEGGTTLVAVMLHQRETHVCTVGDSRLFSYAPDTGLEQLSRDDTLGGALAAIENGQQGYRPTFDLGGSEHEKLVQFLGMGPDLEPHLFALRTRDSERKFLLLCSDGAYRPPGELLPNVVAEAAAPKQLAERLCYFAEWVGGGDDATVAALDLRMLDRAPRERGRALQLWSPSAQNSLAVAVGVRGVELWRLALIDFFRQLRLRDDAQRERASSSLSSSVGPAIATLSPDAQKTTFAPATSKPKRAGRNRKAKNGKHSESLPLKVSRGEIMMTINPAPQLGTDEEEDEVERLSKPDEER